MWPPSSSCRSPRTPAARGVRHSRPGGRDSAGIVPSRRRDAAGGGDRACARRAGASAGAHLALHRSRRFVIGPTTHRPGIDGYLGRPEAPDALPLLDDRTDVAAAGRLPRGTELLSVLGTGADTASAARPMVADAALLLVVGDGCATAPRSLRAIWAGVGGARRPDR